MDELPELSRKSVNKAGQILAESFSGDTVGDDEWFQALEVLSQWRTRHSYPINTFQATLRARLSKLKIENVVVAQRLKRTPSIIRKLVRFEGMMLARMQDIGGLRAVVPNMNALHKLRGSYETSGNSFKHSLVSSKNYIESPKDDGYRSLHQVFKYQSTKAPIFNGLCVELQIRTRLQHAWATAVETTDILLNQALKSGQGDFHYREFFELCGAAICHFERTPCNAKYLDVSFEDIKQQILTLENSLQLLFKLQGLTVATNQIQAPSSKAAAYHLIVLDYDNRELQMIPFARDQITAATEEYSKFELKVQAGAPFEVVLVSAGTAKNIKQAYPNYFLDTSIFVRQIRKIIYPDA